MPKNERSSNKGKDKVLPIRWTTEPEAMVYFRIDWTQGANGQVAKGLVVHPASVNPEVFREAKPKKNKNKNKGKKRKSSPERPHTVRWVLVGHELGLNEKILITAMAGSEGLMEKDEYEIRQGGNCVCGRAKADVGYLKDWHYDIMFVLSKQQPVSLRRPFDWNRVGVDPIVIIKDDGGVPDPIE